MCRSCCGSTTARSARAVRTAFRARKMSRSHSGTRARRGSSARQLGLDVLGNLFRSGNRSFMVGGMYVAPGSELDGMRMFDLSTQTRVIRDHQGR